MDKALGIISILKKMKATEADGWENSMKNSCCPGDDWADGYNQAIKDVIKLMKKKLKSSSVA